MARDIENYFHALTNGILNLIQRFADKEKYVDFFEGNKLFYIGYGNPGPQSSAKQIRIDEILIIVQLRSDDIIVTLKNKKFLGVRAVLAYIHAEIKRNHVNIKLQS